MAKDKVHDIMRYNYNPLDFMFAPKSVALIGASEKEGSVGRTLLWNLISHPFGGTVFPINPKRKNVLGIRAYRNIKELPEIVDLAVIATPAVTVPNLIRECVEAGVKGAIIISAGFKEIGADGIALEQEILKEAKKGNLRIIGPNCLGLICPPTGLNASFASTSAKTGNVAFISQSGAFCTSILDWSIKENLGFSGFISIGSMLDVNWGDLIYYFGDDPLTKSIVIYMESIGDARSFISAAREVALSKPIIVIKGGRTEEAAKAAASHTGALSSSDKVLAAAFRRCGVLQVDTIKEVFNMADLLAKQPRPKGRRLTILTNAGGPGVLATDALTWGKGELASLSETTIEELNAILPTHWSHSNPIDILGDATPQRYAQALEIAAKDDNSDGLLVILTPQDMTDPTQTAEELTKITGKITHKPVLASWMGGSGVATGVEILNRANIYTQPYPDDAARLFNLMGRYSYNLKGLYEIPSFSKTDNLIDEDLATNIIAHAHATNRTLLTEYESKQLLQAYGIPTVTTIIAENVEKAIESAQKIGYPVVMKLHSETITHKTDVGGVRLNLTSQEDIKQAFLGIQKRVKDSDFLGVTIQPMIHLEGYELILGSTVDPQFGPVLLFGTGGQLVEVYQDQAIALPPLNSTLARRLMEQTKIYTALKGVRGRKTVNLAQLEQILVLFSQLVIEQPLIKEIDINPLLVSENNLIALDARVLLYEPNIDKKQIIFPAIRPYPNQYISMAQLADGKEIKIRPIRPEDEPRVVSFCTALSQESVYLRFFHSISHQSLISHERLTRICFIDYNQEIALVASYTHPDTNEKEILAIARLSRVHGNTEQAELGLLVKDSYQKQGLGTLLGQNLIKIAKEEGITTIIAEILPDNHGMQNLCKKLGFELHKTMDLVKAIYFV
ncbi:MAG: bifunctional acetate--CoA ligase family protein/GNAT family N-acetyltransferase [Cyanobacteria bacterium]|nr:bifunctional acetate--CoA ligase family protein/GNAT family N-acetyltransferase [Cyanobacteria bacterium CG_2015-16_32_12]NCO77174.1 bifunctional acetate--CoA ligase family protein/GNAT family N-acetyltransferase [Cyanobacteria bacterium CG_2015-22_32_23]NCQ40779.1 bifunctional acetate--CoA ligase family protein/GNAT family N-acetyltransferase [Cyanobacteria bacterium CG_2015-04_32_10]NCS83363.1 bifunctional acetate--CoA ligase family protein/GNAT family N-acetyltransferase [Cyanobacteria bac